MGVFISIVCFGSVEFFSFDFSRHSVYMIATQKKAPATSLSPAVLTFRFKGKWVNGECSPKSHSGRLISLFEVFGGYMYSLFFRGWCCARREWVGEWVGAARARMSVAIVKRVPPLLR